MHFGICIVAIVISSWSGADSTVGGSIIGSPGTLKDIPSSTAADSKESEQIQFGECSKTASVNSDVSSYDIDTMTYSYVNPHDDVFGRDEGENDELEDCESSTTTSTELYLDAYNFGMVILLVSSPILMGIGLILLVLLVMVIFWTIVWICLALCGTSEDDSPGHQPTTEVSRVYTPPNVPRPDPARLKSDEETLVG